MSAYVSNHRIRDFKFKYYESLKMVDTFKLKRDSKLSKSSDNDKTLECVENSSVEIYSIVYIGCILK